MIRQASSAQVIGSRVGQIPGQAAFAPGDHHPQLLVRIIWVMHGQGENAGGYPPMVTAVPDDALPARPRFPRAIFQAARWLPWASTR